MPQLIEHIDAIARQKQRDVLYVWFHGGKPSKDGKRPRMEEDFAWAKSPVRKQVTEWLDVNHIVWMPCAGVANTNCMMPYLGQIYIDLPFDKEVPEYQKLESYLENPDGSMRVPGAEFCYWPLERAMENSAHDAPGFWEKWAENF